MKLSTNLGLPIAEPDDFATDYPVEVDDPRTTALDTHLLVAVGLIYGATTVPSNASGLTEGVLTAEGIIKNVEHVAGAGGRLKALYAGWYRVSVAVNFEASGGGTIRAFQVYRNTLSFPAVAFGSHAFPSGSTGGGMAALSASQIVPLAVGDFINVGLRQDSGASMSVNCALSMEKVRGI